MKIIIPPLNNQTQILAEQRQQQLTKPTGALGRLETLSCALAAMQGRVLPQCERVTLLIFAGDHGVVAQGVSAYPQIVTAHMCMNFSHGGAAMNVLARQADVQVRVIDVGVKEALPPDSGIIIKKIAHGTQDFTQNSAMNDDECARALAVGAEQVDEVIKSGVDVLAFGEMGIGNTTSASALFAALTGLSPARCVGRGTGISDDMLHKKISVVELGLARHQTKHSDPASILEECCKPPVSVYLLSLMDLLLQLRHTLPAALIPPYAIILFFPTKVPKDHMRWYLSTCKLNRY
jgi:nicotinate-nucleotide--dimethylbenzimidazole phosphoribosyltransferase